MTSDLKFETELMLETKLHWTFRCNEVYAEIVFPDRSALAIRNDVFEES
jgi:hypothetical protein